MNKKPSLKGMMLVLLLLVMTINISVYIPLIHATDQWWPDMRITWDAADDKYPSMAQTVDGKIWFVWYSTRTGDYELYYKVYDPSKVNPWSSDIRLTNTPGIDMGPSVMHAADGRTWVAWARGQIFFGEVFYKIYDGASWTGETNLSNNQSDDAYPSLMQTTNNVIWVFWSSKRTGNYEIFYKTSSNNGASWSSATQVTFTSSQDELSPRVIQSSDGKIWLVYVRGTMNSADIYYRTSSDNGVTWTSELSISNIGNNYRPSIAQATDGKMWVVWDSDRILDPYGDPQNDIFYRVYDSASGWGQDTQLTTDSREDDMPYIMRANDGVLWVAWCAMRQGLFDIYYRTSSPPEPNDVAIFNVAPSKNIVSQNTSVIVEVVAQNHGTNPEDFTVKAYADLTLVGSQQIINLSPGDLYLVQFNWSTQDVPLGNYTIMANATTVTGETNTADNTYVDGKISVVIHDVAVLSVTPLWPFVYQTCWQTVIVEVENKGTIGEEVTVTADYGTNEIGTATIFVGRDAHQEFWFFLDTTNVPYGNYVVSAQAQVIKDEINETNNSLVGGTFKVTIPGDTNGDRVVNILDISVVSAHWTGPPPGPLEYDWAIDINEDGFINMVEVSIVSAHWGQSW